MAGDGQNNERASERHASAERSVGVGGYAAVAQAPCWAPPNFEHTHNHATPAPRFAHWHTQRRHNTLERPTRKAQQTEALVARHVSRREGGAPSMIAQEEGHLDGLRVVDRVGVDAEEHELAIRMTFKRRVD